MCKIGLSNSIQKKWHFKWCLKHLQLVSHLSHLNNRTIRQVMTVYRRCLDVTVLGEVKKKTFPPPMFWTDCDVNVVVTQFQGWKCVTCIRGTGTCVCNIMENNTSTNNTENDWNLFKSQQWFPVYRTRLYFCVEKCDWKYCGQVTSKILDVTEKWIHVCGMSNTHVVCDRNRTMFVIGTGQSCTL